MKAAERWVYLYRLIAQDGQVIELLVKASLAATCQFFAHAPKQGPHPSEATTDRAAPWPLPRNRPERSREQSPYGVAPVARRR